LRGLDLRGCIFRDTVFDGAVMSNCGHSISFAGAGLERASFKGAELACATFQSANMEGAHLQGAKAGQADFNFTRLVAAHFEGAYLAQATFSGEVYDANFTGAKCPLCSFVQGKSFGAVARLDRAIFQDADLSSTRWTDGTGGATCPDRHHLSGFGTDLTCCGH